MAGRPESLGCRGQPVGPVGWQDAPFRLVGSIAGESGQLALGLWSVTENGKPSASKSAVFKANENFNCNHDDYFN